MSNPKLTIQVLDGSSVWSPSEDLQHFRERHANWVSSEHDDDGVAYCLHPEHLDACLDLFELNADSREAEKDLAAVCDRNGAIAVCGDRFIKYSLLQPLLAWPSSLDLSPFLDVGWTQTDIAAVKSLSNPTEKIHHRLRAAAGRLISMPAFLDARNRRRQAWLALPSSIRPMLPIARSARIAAPSAFGLEVAPEPLAEFIKEFDRFCDEWHLLGMASWELPDVRGPNWVPGFAHDDSLRRGNLTINTPWHFPVLTEDGLGRILEDGHRRQAAERGIKDLASWETYAHLLGIYHWENILCARYSGPRRISGFKTKMESALGKILGLGVDRVQKLRKRLHALQSGRLKSLLNQRL